MSHEYGHIGDEGLNKHEGELNNASEANHSSETETQSQKFIKIGKTGEQIAVNIVPNDGPGSDGKQQKVTFRGTGRDFDANKDRTYIAKDIQAANAIVEGMQQRAEKFNRDANEFLADVHSMSLNDLSTLENNTLAARSAEQQKKDQAGIDEVRSKLSEV
jgi:hypothetical protein